MLATHPAGGIPYTPDLHDQSAVTYRLNVIPSKADPRDHIDPELIGVAKLPAMAMFDWVPPIKDQGQEGSCTGNGYAGMRECLLGPDHWTALSPAFTYYEERVLEGDTNQDAGAMPRDGAKTLQKLGICREPFMPYRAGDFATAPSPQALADAANFKISSYARVTTQHAVKAYLAKKIPVGIALSVYEGMERTRNGVIPMPGVGEQSLGGHWVFYTGYCDRPDWPGGGYYRLDNSWSPSWGDRGFGYLPYAYDANTALLQERWRITV